MVSDSRESAPLGRLGASIAFAAALALLSACGESANEKTGSKSDGTEISEGSGMTKDAYLWLEDVEGDRALAWAREQNAVSLARLEGDARYAPIRERLEALLTASDRIPYGMIANEDEIRNFWQDETHVRGLWRRTTLEGYRSSTPPWQTILDLDALAAAEEENWVWKGATCLPPENTRCLLDLSRGGADAVVVREFDAASGQFVADGFALPEEKQSAVWIDADTLLVASPHEGGSKNSSGYARTVRIWKRGTALGDAMTVFTGAETDAFTFPIVLHRPEGTELFVGTAPDFFHQTIYRLNRDGSTTRLPLPADVNFQGMIAGNVIALLRSDWETGAGLAKAGAVVSVPLAGLLAGETNGVSVIAEPDETVAIEGVAIARDAVYVTMLDMVKGRLVRAEPGGEGWTLTDVAVPKTGTVSVVSSNDFSGRLFVNFEQFLVPDTLYLVDGAGKVEALKSMPARFDAERYRVEQRFAISEDGTRVPYFLVRARDIALDGKTPTILYGYGGFEISLTPSYLSPMAIEWLERGGAWAVANIRGGGEFGPRWHKAALKADRPRAYEDFAAVARDLAETGVTSPKHLGIYGGSNGGLLVTATMVRYPDLFGAVVSAVPLIDMLRYHKLLAGASWIGEYGNPDIPAERAWIETYSPYQKVSAGVNYPDIFLTTSTRDDRVHPGHARKMAAKMMAQGHDVLYYENIEGGHAGAANLKQRAMRDALILVYFLQELGGG
ncbi:MAG: prolyl oligopeptidase family protein [Rhodothalassiaceae bacterium]